MSELSAIENLNEIRECVNDLHQKFRANSDETPRLGNTTYWHNRLRISGRFRRLQQPNRYWNAFGTVPHSPRRNIIVEINPPARVGQTNTQGIIARDENEARWLLHKGQLKISGKNISTDKFTAVTDPPPYIVTHSQSEPVECYFVANVDETPDKVQEQIASFVRECQRVRFYYQFGEDAAEREANILQAEAGSPELTGTYHVGPRGSQEIERRHGKVWRALTKTLDNLDRKHTNQRVGNWGPDLITCDDKRPVLFEIKASITATDLQTAVGQLFLYEQLLGTNCRKVLVIPEELSQPLASAVRTLAR